VTAPRNRRHILVPSKPKAEPYRPHGRKVETAKPPVTASRSAHGQALKQALDSAVSEARRRRVEAGIQVQGAIPGLYIQFESQPGVPLALPSLEDVRKGIELVAVSHAVTDEAEPRSIERATVFVPDGKVKHFTSRFEAYAKPGLKKKGERRYESMLDPVADLRLATLRGLWTDESEAYPEADEAIWWEVWLRRRDGNELARLMEFAGIKGLNVGTRRLEFDDRVVLLVRATPRQLSASIDVLYDLAELRRAKETAAVFADMTADDQAEWAQELLTRTLPPTKDAPAVCVPRYRSDARASAPRVLARRGGLSHLRAVVGRARPGGPWDRNGGPRPVRRFDSCARRLRSSAPTPPTRVGEDPPARPPKPARVVRRAHCRSDQPRRDPSPRA
jgi:hypothetical protein